MHANVCVSPRNVMVAIHPLFLHIGEFVYVNIDATLTARILSVSNAGSIMHKGGIGCDDNGRRGWSWR